MESGGFEVESWAKVDVVGVGVLSLREEGAPTEKASEFQKKATAGMDPVNSTGTLSKGFRVQVFQCAERRNRRARRRREE